MEIEFGSEGGKQVFPLADGKVINLFDQRVR
jgi:hypothetical protein